VFQNSTNGLLEGLTEKKQLFGAYVDIMPLKFDLHFFPLSFYCDGLYRNLDEYHFIGNMGTNFYAQLEEAGRRFCIRDTLNEFFKLDHHKNNTLNMGVETAAPMHVHEYYTSKSVRRVLEYVSIDYVLLNLTLPMWAKEMLREDAIR
jgi:hypothetical protein